MLEPIFHDPEKAASPRAALAALAAHLPILTTPGLVFGASTSARSTGEGVIEIGYFSLGPEAVAFQRDAYAYGWVRNFDWIEWSQSTEGQRRLRDPAGLDETDEEDLARVLTVCMRNAHWGPSSLDAQFREGLLTRIAERAMVLLDLRN